MLKVFSLLIICLFFFASCEKQQKTIKTVEEESSLLAKQLLQLNTDLEKTSELEISKELELEIEKTKAKIKIHRSIQFDLQIQELIDTKDKASCEEMAQKIQKTQNAEIILSYSVNQAKYFCGENGLSKISMSDQNITKNSLKKISSQSIQLAKRILKLLDTTNQANCEKAVLKVHETMIAMIILASLEIEPTEEVTEEVARAKEKIKEELKKELKEKRLTACNEAGFDFPSSQHLFGFDND